ncbi:hypothetical protein V1507DRAFT_31850 [Lipomyces tetrasporus]
MGVEQHASQFDNNPRLTLSPQNITIAFLQPGTLQYWRFKMALLSLFSRLQIRFPYASYPDPHAAHRILDVPATHTRSPPSALRRHISNVFSPMKENVLFKHGLHNRFASTVAMGNGQNEDIGMMEWTIERYEVLTSALRKFLDVDLTDLSEDGTISVTSIQRVKDIVDVVIERQAKRKVAEDVRAEVTSNEDLDCDHTEDGNVENANNNVD